MRAVQLVKFGEPREALQYTDLPDPKPGPGEVVVKIEVAGVCGRDLVVRKGAFPHVKPPVVPGHEGVGRVVEVGSGVEKELEGARAFLSAIYDGTCEYCRRGWRICVEMRSFWGSLAMVRMRNMCCCLPALCIRSTGWIQELPLLLLVRFLPLSTLLDMWMWMGRGSWSWGLGASAST